MHTLSRIINVKKFGHILLGLPEYILCRIGFLRAEVDHISNPWRLVPRCVYYFDVANGVQDIRSNILPFS